MLSISIYWNYNKLSFYLTGKWQRRNSLGTYENKRPWHVCHSLASVQCAASSVRNLCWSWLGRRGQSCELMWTNFMFNFNWLVSRWSWQNVRNDLWDSHGHQQCSSFVFDNPKSSSDTWAYLLHTVPMWSEVILLHSVTLRQHSSTSEYI